MRIKHYMYTAVVTLFAIFILQNIETDVVRFLFWDFSLPRAILLLFTLCLGLVMGALIPFNKLLPARKANN